LHADVYERVIANTKPKQCVYLNKISRLKDFCWSAAAPARTPDLRRKRLFSGPAIVNCDSAAACGKLSSSSHLPGDNCAQTRRSEGFSGHLDAESAESPFGFQLIRRGRLRHLP